MTGLQQIFENTAVFFTTWGSLNYCSMEFLLLFIAFYAIYIPLRGSRRKLMMIYVVAFSLLFAYKANGWMMLLLPFTTLCSWWLTERVKMLHAGRGKKLMACFTVVWIFMPLLYFKYADFGLQSVNDLIQTNFELLDIVLPAGISFYTFQAVSYVIDVYKGKFRENVSLLEYFFYLTFFPLLMAGPITRAATLFPQIKKGGSVDSKLVYSGLWFIILGILKKGLIADYLAQYNTWIFDDPMAFSGLENAMGIFGYGMQIYLDFSGYSDMSIGLSALLGFYLPPNFESPYRSLNISDYWRRWHIALSSWFRDYVYIPLGGNRKGRFRTYLNNFVTMVLAGIWHGASWMFVIWGAYHGVGLVLQKMCKPAFRKINATWLINTTAWLLTFSFVTFGWILFRSPDIQTAEEIIHRIFTDFDLACFIPFCEARPIWTTFAFFTLVVHLMVTPEAYNLMQTWFVRSHWIVKLLIFLVAIQLIISLGTENVQPFIYAQF